MKEEPRFDLIQFLKEAESRKIRLLLIGRWAVAQHGAPVVTADYDFWIHPKERIPLFHLLDEVFDAELPPKEDWDKPIITVFIGPDKVDCFSPKKIVNEEGQELVFDEIYSRAEVKRDPDENLIIRIPKIDDLIAMKKFTQRDPLKQARNLEDIRYLQTLKAKRPGRKRP